MSLGIPIAHKRTSWTQSVASIYDQSASKFEQHKEIETISI